MNSRGRKHICDSKNAPNVAVCGNELLQAAARGDRTVLIYSELLHSKRFEESARVWMLAANS